MKKSLLIAFIFRLCFLTACKHECKVVKQTYPNGQVKELRIYPNCDDTTYFLRQHFYDNGQMSSEGHYKNYDKVGKFRSWASNGHLTADWQVVNGKEDGYIQCWYDNGNKKRQCTLINGLVNGLKNEWFENGKKASTGNCKNGKRQGKFFTWEENTKDWYLKTYKDDSLWGETIEHHYDSTGNKKEIVVGQYENGKETGIWKWFDKDSILTETVIYVKGVLNGNIIRYYSSGKIESIEPLTDGMDDGTCKYFDENNNLTETVVYVKNKRIGDLTKYYSNGKPKSITPYKNDLVDGVCKYYDNKGTLTKTEIYKKGKLQK
jgi:antitoxin component YwqK of YwqJK toxin-antitoxin module